MSLQIHRAWLSGAAYAGMFGFGIVMALLGAVLPILASHLNFDLARAGDLFLAMNGAMLVTTIALGPVIDRFGHKSTLLVAPLFVAAALGLIPKAAAFGDLFLALVLLGIGGAALNQVTNTLIADLYEDAREKSAELNILGVFFGFGALLIPLLIGSLLRELGFVKILYFAMGLALVPAILSAPSSFPVPRPHREAPFNEISRLVRQPLVLTFALLLFFESGNEFIAGGYVSTYLTGHLGVTVQIASYLLSVYWGALMLGRIVLSRLVLQINGGSLVLTSALAVAGSVALLLVAHSIALAAVAVILLGLSIALIFPTVLGLAGSAYPTHSGTVFGILIAIALGGGMTLPWLVGKVAGIAGLRAALLIVILDTLAIFAFQFRANRILRSISRSA